MGEDDIITPEVLPVYFLSREKYVVAFIASMKQQYLMTRRVIKRRLVGKQQVPDAEAQKVPEDITKLFALVGTASLDAAHWDVDFLVLAVLPRSLALFADIWTLGGSCQRGHASNFPSGLELATSPFTLRAAPVDGDCRPGASHQYSLV